MEMVLRRRFTQLIEWWLAPSTNTGSTSLELVMWETPDMGKEKNMQWTSLSEMALTMNHIAASSNLYSLFFSYLFSWSVFAFFSFLSFISYPLFPFRSLAKSWNGIVLGRWFFNVVPIPLREIV
jgi:hypothetical protein